MSELLGEAAHLDVHYSELVGAGHDLMTQAELGKPLTADEIQRLASYRIRLANYWRLHRHWIAVLTQWNDQRQRAVAQRPRLALSLEVLEALNENSAEDQDSIAELAELLDQLQGSSPKKRAQVERWEKQLDSLRLSSAEEVDLKRLAAREARPIQLALLQAGWEAGCRQLIDEVEAQDPLFQLLQGKEWWKHNLPARINRYEENKESAILDSEDLSAFAYEAIAQVKQDIRELKDLAMQHWPNDVVLARAWRETITAMLKEFAQHVEKDLSELVLDSATPASVPLLPFVEPSPPAKHISEQLPPVPKIPETSHITVSELCLTPFTSSNLTEVLRRLAVIDDKGNCLTNELQGKARGKRGAYTATYRVLHRTGLLAPTGKDAEWADAFKAEYGAILGVDVIAHQLTAHGRAPSSSPTEFSKAVATVTAWVEEWKNRPKE